MVDLVSNLVFNLFVLCSQVVHSRFQDLVPVHLKDEGDPDLERPSEEDIEEVN